MKKKLITFIAISFIVILILIGMFTLSKTDNKDDLRTYNITSYVEDVLELSVLCEKAIEKGDREKSERILARWDDYKKWNHEYGNGLNHLISTYGKDAILEDSIIKKALPKPKTYRISKLTNP